MKRWAQFDEDGNYHETAFVVRRYPAQGAVQLGGIGVNAWGGKMHEDDDWVKGLRGYADAPQIDLLAETDTMWIVDEFVRYRDTGDWRWRL